MSKIQPYLLETSKGYINMSQVQMIRVQRNRDTAEFVFQSGDVVEFSTNEWMKLYGKLAMYLLD
jgi:hypothetical protein